MFRKIILIFMLVTAGTFSLYATAPYGDPNQPYDKLPGTLETYHTKWATPLPGGKLKILFIIPYSMSREVVELRQRLDLDYTVIMNVNRSSWWQGYREGGDASPIANGEYVLNKIVDERLDLSRNYDAIVIGKVSWEVIPVKAKDLILSHVRRGTALVYVSPHRAGAGWQGITPQVTTPDPQYEKLFLQNDEPDITYKLTEGLPLDVIPLTLKSSIEEVSKLPQSPTIFNTPIQKPVNIRTTKEGKGSIVVLDYCDLGIGVWGAGNGLTSGVLYDTVMYDYEYALLARCILYGVNGENPIKSSVFVKVPGTTSLKAPEGTIMPAGWDIKSPRVVVDRENLKDARIIVSVDSLSMKGRFTADVQIRNARGNILQSESKEISLSPGKGAGAEFGLPILPRGTYLVDLFVKDNSGRIMNFASSAFRVETAISVTEIKTDREYYEKGSTISGEVFFSEEPSAGQVVEASAIDTWGREVVRVPVLISSDGKKGTFTIPVLNPLSRLWDISVVIKDVSGNVSENRIWVGLPDWNFDDYYVPLIFTAGPVPQHGWRGYLYTEQVRKYGINGYNTGLIYGRTYEYEYDERAHLISFTQGEHLGENGLGTGMQSGFKENRESEYTGPSIAELVVMMKDALNRGTCRIDTDKYPEVLDYGNYQIDGDWINSRMKMYREISKFGTPYVLLSGENYLLGEPTGKEISGFSPASTRLFQEWCKEEYKDDINALNTEWGSDFKDWEEVRGILFTDAYKKKQMPRWVAFRYFMRSRVFTEFFILYTRMIQKNIGYPLHTVAAGHEYLDISRFRDVMTAGKLYVGQETNWEYRRCAGEELRQSFSGDKSFLLSSQSMMMFNFDLKTPLNNHRLPWKALFAGYRGFDWEASAGSFNSLGGMSCMTPCYSEPLPFFKNISEQVLYLENGIGKLCITSKIERAPVAILWSLPNHYISRLYPRQEQGFTGGWLYNIDVDGGAITDVLVLMKNIRIRPTFIAPEDVVAGDLIKRGFKALILPYNKGMSDDEAKAILAFIEQGGLVIADNQPGIFTRFGRLRDKPVLFDIFPVTDRENIVQYGKGTAAYLPGVISGYLSRIEQGDYAGSDSVALLLDRYAGIKPPVELLDGNGKMRRDTLMPVYINGNSRFVGMMRADTSAGREVEETKVNLDRKYYVWDVRDSRYFGYIDTFEIKLDMYPKFFALLPVNPVGLDIKTDIRSVRQGGNVKVEVQVNFQEVKNKEDISGMGQVVHLKVYSPDGEELEWYRKNIVFTGKYVDIEIPVSYTEKPGLYKIKVEYPITGMSTSTTFNVIR